MGAVVLLLAAHSIFWWPHQAYHPWYWPHQRHFYYHHRVGRQPPLPDCDKINAAVKMLTPERYEAAMRLATKKEQETIANCAVRPW